MRSRLLILFAGLIALLPEAGAQSTTPPNSASIDGVVVKEPGSEPLKKVLLQFIAEDQKQGANYSATTDPDGHFRIQNVQSGRYRLFLEKAGFVQVSRHNHKLEGSVLDVRPGQQISDLKLQMLPTAVIAGRVVDEDGDPMPNINVSVQRKKPSTSREAETYGAERTNDLGEFRISGLLPGQYFVAAIPAPDFTSATHSADSAGESKPDMSYLPAYYPGTNDSGQAAPVTLRAGDEMPVNFSLTLSRTYRIRGFVSGTRPGQKPMVQLVSKGVNGVTMNAADVGEDGRFELRSVAPGSYWITTYSGAEGEILTGRQSVTVSAGDVEGVKLAPVRPFTLSGHLRFEGEQPKDITQYTAYLQNAEDGEDGGGAVAFVPGSGPLAKIDRQGNFQWTGVVPGRYIAQVSGNDGRDSFLKSVTVGNRDASTGFVTSGPMAVEMVVSSKGAEVEGVVREKDQPVPNASVVAVPEEKYCKVRDRFGIGTSDQNGRFVIHGLTPGTYTLYAWQDVEEGSYYDPDFVKSQAGNGSRLKVEEGSRYDVELPVSPVSDDWQ